MSPVISLVFPHQLFAENPALHPQREVLLVEEWLFFRQYKFHKQKLRFHRASMQYYRQMLLDKGFNVSYIEAASDEADVRRLLPMLAAKGVREIHYCDPTDDWLEKRIEKAASENGIKIKQQRSPAFLNSAEELDAFFDGRKRYFQTDFYIHERKKRGLLLDNKQKPLGGKWSYDAENRLKYPAGKTPPPLLFPAENNFYREATVYVQQHFGNNPGLLNEAINYPCTHDEAAGWLRDFIRERFYAFGPYEDALLSGQQFLHHSVLTPMLNSGLLTPQQILDEVLAVEEGLIPLNSMEGFVRQLTGWREFIRAIYRREGRRERSTNFWGFSRKLPPSFYDGTTGIYPVDNVIQKVLKTGYAHHIERLMVLGNFMLLCEFDPDEVYRWFMEMFIDAYDWVMVPNVYGMSQFADGGLMATKPYISGSNYLMKMSDYPKGEWQQLWDGLFWRFMDKQRSFFLQNPRLGMLVRSFDNMPESKQSMLIQTAASFLESLDGSQ